MGTKDVERVKRWKKLNPEKAKKHVINHRLKHPKNYMWRRAKIRANKLGLEFTITPDDIHIPMICPYLYIPLTFEQEKGWVDSNYSLDRIDNSKGYTPDNIEVISCLANKMKANASWEQLTTFALGVINRAVERGRESPGMAMCSLLK